MPVGPFFPSIPEWAWKALGEVSRDAPEQFPRALAEALAALRASSPKLASMTMNQLVKSLALGTGAPLGAAPEVLAAIEGLGGVSSTIVAGEAAAATAGAVAGGTAVVAAAEVAGGSGAVGGAATAAGWFGGISVGVLTLGAVVVGGLLVGGVIWYRSRDACACEKPTSEPPPAVRTVAVGGQPRPAATVATPAPTCAPLVQTVKLCPDSPKNADAKACGPGYCWDGGFNHSLACKQEVLPVHAHRTYTNDVACDAGFVEVRDPCTNVISACRVQ